MKCACGSESCKSRIGWDTGSHSLSAIRGHNISEELDVEILLYYDANSLVELIKEAKEALIELTREVS